MKLAVGMAPMLYSQSVSPTFLQMVFTIPASAKKLRTSSRLTNWGTAMVIMKQVRQNFFPLVFLLLMNMASKMPPM